MNQPPEKLPSDSSDRSWLCDLLGFGLVAVFALIALWGCGFDFSAIGSMFRGDEFAREDIIISLGEIGDQAASAVLVISMAWVVSLCYGAVDLSIFSVAALGGIVSAALINCGVGPAVSLGAGLLAGGAIGAINGLLVSRVPIWSFLITGVVGLVLMSAIGLGVSERAIQIPTDAFDSLRISADIPVPQEDSEEVILRRVGGSLSVTRRLIVASIYILVVVLLSKSIGSRDGKKTWPKRRKKMIALWVSGGLAGAGGSLWLIDYGYAPVLTRPVGDLLPLAAALLAGAVLYRSPRRGALAVVALVAGVVGATYWQQKVWIYPLAGYNAQLVLLIVMVLIAHGCISRASGKTSGGSVGRWLAAAFTCGGLIVACLSATFNGSSLRIVIFWAGLTLWFVGAAAWGLQEICSLLASQKTSCDGQD